MRHTPVQLGAHAPISACATVQLQLCSSLSQLEHGMQQTRLHHVRMLSADMWQKHTTDMYAWHMHVFMVKNKAHACHVLAGIKVF